MTTLSPMTRNMVNNECWSVSFFFFLLFFYSNQQYDALLTSSESMTLPLENCSMTSSSVSFSVSLFALTVS